MFILRGTSSIVHMTLHQPPLLLRILEKVTKSLESCANSLEMECIFYKRNIHAAYLTRDVPKDSSVDTVDSSIVGQALLGQIHVDSNMRDENHAPLLELSSVFSPQSLGQ